MFSVIGRLHFLLYRYSIWFQLQTTKHIVCCSLRQVNVRGKMTHTYMIVSTYRCHDLLFLLRCNDGWHTTAHPAHYHMFSLKPKHNLVYCRFWHSTGITKFIFKQSTSLFEWFIVWEINLDQVTTLFRGKNYFKHSVQILPQTRMKHFCCQRRLEYHLGFVQACRWQFSNIPTACFVSCLEISVFTSEFVFFLFFF